MILLGCVLSFFGGIVFWEMLRKPIFSGIVSVLAKLEQFFEKL